MLVTVTIVSDIDEMGKRHFSYSYSACSTSNAPENLVAAAKITTVQITDLIAHQSIMNKKE